MDTEIIEERWESLRCYQKVINGSVNDVKNFLQHDVNINRLTFTGYNHLHIAVKKNSETLRTKQSSSYLEITKLLLDYGADINFPDRNGVTSLHHALLSGDNNMVQVLLCKRLNFVKVNDKIGNILLEQTQNVVDFLLKNGDDFNISTEHYPILLEFAARNGDEKSFETILMRDKDFDVNSCIPGTTSATIFHTVAERGTCKMIRNLVNHKANVDKQDMMGYTPLHYTIRSGRFFQSRFLLQCGASVLYSNVDGKSTLHLAAQFGADKEIIQSILSKGIDVNINNSRNGKTPLHLACERAQNLETVTCLYENGANLNAKDEFGETPFHKACLLGYLEIASYLIHVGVDLNVTNEQGQNALHYSILGSSEISTIELLLRKGINVNARDIHERTALHYICRKLSHYNSSIIKIFMEYGADINAKDNKGDTPLHTISTNYVHRDTLKYILEANADINVMNQEGDTPLSSALKIYNINRLAFQRKNLMEPLIEHLVKVKAVKCKVCNENFEFMKDDTLHEFYITCKSEIYKIEQKICISSNVSFLDFLTKDVNKLAAFLRNRDIIEALNSYSFIKEFPIYGNLLARRFTKAKSRLPLLMATTKIFKFQLKLNLPDIMLDKIYEYLREKDLKCFVETF